MHEQDVKNIQGYKQIISIGLPKGRMFKKSKNVVENYTAKEIQEGKLCVEHGKWRFYFLKHRDIPRLVESGILDFGITSDEWIAETGVNINRIKELDWCNTRIAVIKSKEHNGKFSRCVTEFYNIAKKHFGESVEVERISGSSEAFVPSIYDCCVDCVESGSALKANNLCVEEEILSSKTVLIGGKTDVKVIKKFVEIL